jgi:hypothetical protein
MLEATKELIRISPFIWRNAVDEAWVEDRYDDLDINSTETAAPPTRLWLKAIVECARIFFATLLCDVRGHRYVADLDYPDSGGWSVTCECCGHFKRIWQS